MTALRAGISAYNAKNQYARPDWGFDTFAVRQARYDFFQHYHDGTIYNAALNPSALTMREEQRLYRWTRNIHNPVKRTVDIMAANIYQGYLDTANLKGGALPLLYDNRALDVPLRRLMRDSNLSQNLIKYSSTAVLKGDAAWWLVDDVQRGRIRMELLDPSIIRDCDVDAAGNSKACIIEYERTDPKPMHERVSKPSVFNSLLPSNDTYLYTMVVTQDEFRTYRDGIPYGYTDDEDGEPLARWDNPYGFVPLKLGHYEQGDGVWGRNAFYAVTGKINELNDAQSLVNDSIRRVVEPILVAENITKVDSIVPSRDEKSGITILYIQGTDSTLRALELKVDISGAMANIREMVTNIENDLPVLALQQMRGGERVTAPGTTAGFSDAIGMVEGARKNLDAPLAAALQMGITMGAVRGYDDFRGFNVNSYDSGDMALSVGARPVIADNLPKRDKLMALLQMKDQPPALTRLALKELGYGETDIEAVLADAPRLNAGSDAAGTVDSEEDDVLTSLFGSFNARVPQLTAGDDAPAPA